MFHLISSFKPKGDQISAIQKITNNFALGTKEQILHGATGTGKTFTIANIINKLQKNTLIIAPNKTLAGQLYSELKSFFPNNRVELFISYYDYYMPEAYIVSSDTYIEKESSINDEIDEMRHSATQALLSDSSTIVVASVSCIYGVGDIDDYLNATLFLKRGMMLSRTDLINKLVQLQFVRNDFDLQRGTFRVNGSVVDIIPISQSKEGLRVILDDDKISEISSFNSLTNNKLTSYDFQTIYPATHFVTTPEKLEEAIRRIEEELKERLVYFNSRSEILYAQRLKEKTLYDIAMLKEVGYCSGVENYSRHIALKPAGATPTTLIDFFKNDYLLVIDESHITIPQIRGMFNGDRSRKQTLVNYGFRLPSALDNRPLYFEEFARKKDKVLYLSATPGDYELSLNIPIIDQIIRPTFIPDPEIIVKPTSGQIEDVLFEIKQNSKKGERCLVTTLTKKLSEEITNFLSEKGIKVQYLHSEIGSLERLKILGDLRKGTYDVVVGINLLREGLDLPEVSLICVLDADKEGFLRSTRSLIQTVGRAARNVNGRVIFYADIMTNSINETILETKRRRDIQLSFNKENNITPKTIIKPLPEVVSNIVKKHHNKKEHTNKSLTEIYNEMIAAAEALDFETAIILKEIYLELKNKKEEKSV